MKSTLKFASAVAALGVMLALMRSPGPIEPGRVVILVMLALYVGWYAERARNWRHVLRTTKKSIPGFRRATWRARAQTAMVVAALVLVLYAGASKEG
jgi:hypothetical protein